MKKIAVIGGGAWGSALALHAASAKGEPTGELRETRSRPSKNA
jgi:glycerol-3-phosphate dehydrogenase